ncbi:DUF6262 family protein [Nostoc sp. WHI]|uniref:DUF6262 family protein n=1 Tax=Nostoc sp. WHI TaxID=2650611 RepID=UPI0018C69DAE|nr:DUF6262 family protein [Nostoc sp. WHI]MBG1268562.1 transposase [Nostoc sp. WHI]
MAKNHNRDKQAEVLRRTQAQRKEQKKEQVLKAIQEILAQKQPLTFANIANVAGCSISYLYKWDEIKAYIHDIQHEKETQLNPLEEKDPRPHSLKTLHEVARQRIRQLEAEIRELKHQNEKLKGHVAEIYELRDECDRLRSQLREKASTNSSTKIVPIRINQSETSSSTTNIHRPSEVDAADIQPEDSDIFQLIYEMGVKVNSKLKQEIANREYHKVKLSIEAFQEYCSKTDVENPAACLLTMIRDEAKPNIVEKSTPQPSNQPSVIMKHNQKKLISQDQLKQLSRLFNEKNEE